MDWRKRTIAVRKLLGDDIQSVIDVGAGSMFLGRLLNPEVRYYPVDYERHCDETLVCDLNAYQFPDIKADAAVLAGILEYLNDIDWLFDTLAERVSMIVLSYKGKEGGFEQSIYSSDELITKLRQRGFILTGWDKEFKEWPLLARFQKAQPQLLAENYFCTGCGACVNACEAGAIELKPDFQGFLKPQTDTAKCVGCNRCVNVCPSANIHENYHNSAPDCYAAWAQDEIRMDSSSGGAFTVLAQHILRQGGAVFGAAWTEDFHLEHVGIDTVEELPKLRHSKYVQSNTKDTFRQVKEILECGHPVLYVGTPCQIAGLHAFLGKPYEGLCTVDLVCFCVTPVNAFRKYLSEQYGIENVEQVVFRDKQCGWRSDVYSIWKRDGSVSWLDVETGDYQKAYYNVLLRNKTCEGCIYADFPRQGDITLGDFWGIEQHDPSWNDGKGTSMVFINSEKARCLLNEVQPEFQRIAQVPLEWAGGKGNRIRKDGRPRHKRAEDFLNNLNRYSFKELVDTILFDTRDIGLICLHNNNYGNNLTNYALYQYLNDAGYSVALIDQAKDAPWVPYSTKLSLFGHIPYKDTDLFPSADNKLQQKQLNNRCGCFIVGSDQLFRAVFIEGLALHPCMDWVTSDKLKVSYATSFGVGSFEGNATLKAKMGYFLKRFQAISVREDSGIEILKRNFGITDGVCVLDPVFICDKRHYENMAQYGKMRLPQNAYVGAYILDVSDEKTKMIHKILSENGLQNFNLITDGEATEQEIRAFGSSAFPRSPLVEEWLANVLYSDVFITDSFHGACFALIFQKDFWIVTNEDSWRGGNRLQNLVGMLGIEDRLIFEGSDWSKIDFRKHIDYAKVAKTLDQKREESTKWLEAALKLRNTFSQSYSTYDILGERIDSNLENLQRIERRVIDDEKRFEIVVKDTAVHLQGIVREGLARDEDQRQFHERLISIQQEETAARLQLQKMLEEEIIKNQETELKLEQALNEKHNLEQQISTILQSNSWQITRPFRKIKAFLKRLFG
ncbi:polysaccharide pyruvyl transferase family protein [uncultured Mailhella sp.]|uniref:polysaccharide pyruvyl transferase family protein n=1 Tax=uncultured Mailhella sp. TaxID=1981031 RepID=UPI002635F9B5|nr:polysaccharide pyruvyl transferase family protein [uncultured Mailhella sp.]